MKANGKDDIHHQSIRGGITGQYQMIVVDDGSADSAWQVIKARRTDLTGGSASHDWQEAAIMAGLSVPKVIPISSWMQICSILGVDSKWSSWEKLVVKPLRGQGVPSRLGIPFYRSCIGFGIQLERHRTSTAEQEWSVAVHTERKHSSGAIGMG